jgi:hypothetical protein
LIQLRSIQTVVLLLSVTLTAAGCGSATPTHSPAPSTTDARPDDPLGDRIRVQNYGSDVVAATEEALAREGVATVPSAAVTGGSALVPTVPLTGPASPLSVLDEQSTAMALDAWSDAGIDGTQLDSMVSLPEGTPPPSLILAAYVDLGYTADATPGARLAANLVGKVDGSAAASTAYPLVVLALLTADMSATGQATIPGVRGADFLSSPCEAVANFFDGALNSIFNAVKSNSSSFPATLWNVIVTIGQGVVVGLIKTLTAPLLAVVAKIIGVVGIAVEAVSFLRPWTLKVVPDDQHTRFSVGGEAAIVDPVRLSVELGGADSWPPALEGCAKAAGFTLPDLLPKNAPVHWTDAEFPDPLYPVSPLVIPNSPLDDVLGADGKTALQLDTGHEENDDGDVHVGLVRFRATVTRPELETFKQQLSGLVVNGLPPIVRDAVASIIAGPISAAVGQLAALTDESGDTGMAVTYHEPKETPEPTAPPTPQRTPQATPKPPRPPIKPKGGTDPCASGCAESVGDPHLQTLDGQEYDFQGAGEYTLLRASDGSMEIQAREVPYPGVADVSINTALAWRVADHRVAMYGTADGYTLTVDGAPPDPSAGTLDLGSGASVTDLGDGVEVAYPDGTIATAVSHGNGFAGALDIEVAPSDTLRNDAHGLLAPIASGSELPAMPDGSALLLSADRATRYHQRYEVFAPAWHVTAATSLFDYSAGQSSASFDVAAFPSANVAFDLQEFEARAQQAAIDQATEQCAAVGDNPKLVQKCVYDIVATNNPAFAQVYQLVDKFLKDGPNGLADCSPPIPPPGMAVTPCLDSVSAEALGSDGTLYAAAHVGSGAEVIAVDTTTGSISRSVGFQNVTGVAAVSGSVWVAVGNFVNNTGTCELQRLDAATLSKQAAVSVDCIQENGFEVPQLFADSQALWVSDGSTVRAVDTNANQLGAPVALPVSGSSGHIAVTDQVVYDEDIGSDQGHWYRLGAGETSFSDLGVLPGFGDAVVGGGGLWLDAADLSGEQRFTTSNTPDAKLPIDGTLAAADDVALYVARDDVTTSHSELWRYALDGTAPAIIAQNDVSVPLLLGSQALSYASAAAYTFASDKLVASWLLSQGTASVLYVQPVGLAR